MHGRGTCNPAGSKRTSVPQELCSTELEPMLDQLRRDMQHWRPRSITPAMLNQIRAAHRDDPVRVSLTIVNRTVWYLRPLGMPRSPMVIALVHDLQELADQHEVPDVEFVLNVDDYPFVSRARAEGSPPLPLFGHYQTTAHNDILCPGGSFREGRYDRLMLCGRSFYRDKWPWREKLAKGFWQGHPYCGQHVFGRCSRYLIPHLSYQNASALLDAGLSFYEDRLDPYLKQAKCPGARCTVGFAKQGDLPRPASPLGLRRWVPIDEHPRYRFLLQLDGHTCSWRMQFLLATNSVVLKQRSYYWEFYYGALEPHVHYVPFWVKSAHDIIDVLPNVSAPEYDASMRKIGRRGQAFAHRHLNAHARQCYWRALLALYAARLQRPPSLARWPHATRARDNGKEGWHALTTERGKPRLRWEGVADGWRRRDDESLRGVVQGIEAELAGAPPARPFTTAVERRAPRF